MKKQGLVTDREIDAIIVRENEYLKIELKLLGIGNPEIADEAIARSVDLFLVDQLSEKMQEKCEKEQIKVIQFRNGSALKELYTYLSAKGIQCALPQKVSLGTIKKTIAKWDPKQEELRILATLKSLTQ